MTMSHEASEEDFFIQKQSKGTRNEMSPESRTSHCVKVGLASYDIAISFDAKSQLETNPIQVIPEENIVVGQLLGVGGFNEVISVVVQEPSSPETKKNFAMKRLLPRVMESEDEFYGAALDLVLEAKILSRLCHQNIIRLHGVSCDDDSLKSCYAEGNQYCLYLDVFYVTVRDRFDEWRNQHRFPHTRKGNLHKRLQAIALPIAEAMDYLHSCNIIFRDLKPENMGIDVEGTVKLFDFGLARETNPAQRMTSLSGSRTYMAPEVAQSQPYGLSADVYSFGVFLYECCTLAKRKLHIFPLCSATSRSLQKLIQQCRSKSENARPTFGDIVDQLRMEVADLQYTKSERQVRNRPSQRWSQVSLCGSSS